MDGRADLRCTPGATNPDVTQASIGKTICVPGWTAKIRPPVAYTNLLKTSQMIEYGETGPPSEFEEDHLINLGSGGAPGSPQPLPAAPNRTSLSQREGSGRDATTTRPVLGAQDTGRGASSNPRRLDALMSHHLGGLGGGPSDHDAASVGSTTGTNLRNRMPSIEGESILYISFPTCEIENPGA